MTTKPSRIRLQPSRREFLSWAGVAAGGLVVVDTVAAATAMFPQAAATAAPAGAWADVDAILARIVAPTFPARDFPITDYGAKADGTTDCTEAIRKAIAACNQAGGGRVVVPAGRYLTGAIHLRSRVNLHVPRGPRCCSSTDPRALPAARSSRAGKASS